MNLEDLTPEQSEALLKACEKELARKDPFTVIEDGHLWIKTKHGTLQPFIMNKAQRHIHRIVKKLWNEDKLIRLFILKARQLGISTYIEALIFVITSQMENQNSLILADDLDGANYIFEMSKLYQEKIPQHLLTPVKKSNEKKLEFDGTHSQIIIDTAENPDAGRKYTFRIAHLSEYAFYSKVDELMLGLMQAVPALPRTMIIKETTANGFNFAKDEWDALDDSRSDEMQIFIPWFWGEEYRMPAEGFSIGDPEHGLASAEESDLWLEMKKANIGCIEERLAWRRWCIYNNCGKGSMRDMIANFKQEYPSTPEEAFRATGESFFDKEEVSNQLKAYQEPLFKADIIWLDGESKLIKSPEGVFDFWEEPKKGVEYCIGGDASSGVGADYSTLVARRKDNNAIVATYRGKIEPDELERKVRLLGWLLNQAVIGLGNDRFGFAVNQKLLKSYGKIYYQEVLDEKTQKTRKKFGWDENSKTRPLMLGQMQAEIKDQALRLRNKVLMKECLTFIENPKNGRVEAQEGCNDDFVIACAISGMLRALSPYKKKPEVKKPNRAFSKFSGNGGFGFGES